MNIIQCLDDPNLFQKWFSGESWSAWRTILKASFALPMTDEEVSFFRTIAEREPPKSPVNELIVIAGRRAGKDSVASLLAAYSASMFTGQASLRPGERGVVMALACDRDQANRFELHSCVLH